MSINLKNLLPTFEAYVKNMTDEEVKKSIEKAEKMTQECNDDFVNYITYEEVPEEYDFNTIFPTYIIAFCPDTDSWFVTNQRFFWYEYQKEFETEEEGIDFFKNNTKIFYDLELKMGIYRPSFYENYLCLDIAPGRSELIEIKE